MVSFAKQNLYGLQEKSAILENFQKDLKMSIPTSKRYQISILAV